jgi:hypothetical protein
MGCENEEDDDDWGIRSQERRREKEEKEKEKEKEKEEEARVRESVLHDINPCMEVTAGSDPQYETSGIQKGPQIQRI